jgi:hypothetical protein
MIIAYNLPLIVIKKKRALFAANTVKQKVSKLSNGIN